MKQTQITYMHKNYLYIEIFALIRAHQTQIQTSWNIIHCTDVANVS